MRNGAKSIFTKSIVNHHTRKSVCPLSSPRYKTSSFSDTDWERREERGVSSDTTFVTNRQLSHVPRLPKLLKEESLYLLFISVFSEDPEILSTALGTYIFAFLKAKLFSPSHREKLNPVSTLAQLFCFLIRIFITFPPFLPSGIELESKHKILFIKVMVWEMVGKGHMLFQTKSMTDWKRLEFFSIFELQVSFSFNENNPK